MELLNFLFQVDFPVLRLRFMLEAVPLNLRAYLQPCLVELFSILNYSYFSKLIILKCNVALEGLSEVDCWCFSLVSRFLFCGLLYRSKASSLKNTQCKRSKAKHVLKFNSN